MSRRPVLKVPSIPITTPSMQKPDDVMKMAAKWIPLICAGAAIGVSVIALKEIHNTRKELMNLKKEQLVPTNSGNEILGKKMELMESQLAKITEYLRNSQRPMGPPPPVRREEIIKKAIIPEAEEVKIINESQEDEYEEIEVTDDETE